MVPIPWVGFSLVWNLKSPSEGSDLEIEEVSTLKARFGLLSLYQSIDSPACSDLLSRFL